MLAAYSQGNVPERPGSDMLASIFRNYLDYKGDEMAHENEGLPGLYKKEREAFKVAATPDGVRRNSKKISELEKRIIELEEKTNEN